jgi:hypothetical protein
LAFFPRTLAGRLTVIKAYVDESGTHDDSEMLAVAAYFAKSSAWQRWTAKWNFAKRPVRVFHAYMPTPRLEERFIIELGHRCFYGRVPWGRGGREWFIYFAGHLTPGWDKIEDDPTRN